MIPRKREVKNYQLEREILLKDTIEAICPACQHELRIRKDEHVHCLRCLMKGTISPLIPKIIKKNRTIMRRNSKMVTYRIE